MATSGSLTTTCCCIFFCYCCCHFFVARDARARLWLKPVLRTIRWRSGQLISMPYKLEHQTALCQLGTGLYCYWPSSSISTYVLVFALCVCAYLCVCLNLACSSVKSSMRRQQLLLLLLLQQQLLPAARLTMCSALVHILLLN